MELLLGYTVLRELSSNYSYYLRTLYNQPHSALAAALAQLFTIPVAVITTRQQTHVDIAKDDSIAKPTNDVDELQLLPSEVFKKKKAAKIEQHTTVQPAASTIAGRKRLSMRQALDLIVAEDGWTGLW